MGILTVDVEVTITFDIAAMPVGVIPTAVSLIVTDAGGNSTFDTDGITIGAVYTAPTTTVDGSYVFDYTFTTPGNWEIALADGVAGAYTRLYNRQMYINEGDAVFVTNIIFPETL